MRYVRAVGAVATLALFGSLASCPDDSGEVGVDIDTRQDTIFGEILEADVEVKDTSDADDAQDTRDTSDTSCEGCFGAPCDDNADCLSGFCLPGPEGAQCTDRCVESCPAGYDCRAISTGGADLAFVCLYDHLAWCMPCDDASDCVDPLNPGAATECRAEADGSGSFCRTACNDSPSCPSGAVCNDGYCESEEGAACACSWWASERGASTACEVQAGERACGGRRVCDVGGAAALAACDAPTPADETCNGVDDDCDGDTDEDFATLGQACDRDDDNDSCARGKWTCGDGGVVVCFGDEAAAEETCNGIDDDCDDRTDETFPGDGDACDSSDDDDCEDDVVRCVSGNVACVDVAATRIEICNGVDDDCDGFTDGDDPGLVSEHCENLDGVCGAAMKPGRLCQSGAWLPCDDEAYRGAGYQGGFETSCDGADNDCDGEVDEDFEVVLADDSIVSGIGVACGAGACGGSVTTCNPTHDGIVCPGSAAHSNEVCNGLDDDCDGVAESDDPDLMLARCEKDAGVCAGAVHPASSCGGELGWLACSDAVYATRSPYYQAGRELACDKRDNDCDGVTDDDFALLTLDGQTVNGVGAACGVGACAGGFTVCSGDETRTSCSTAGNAHAEVCNGVDDDCDGLVDGDDPDMLRPNCEEQRGVCGGAKKTVDLCVAGVWQPCGAPAYVAHVSDYAAIEARCDGRDEDCDGRVDDDFEVVTLDGAVVRGAGSACGVGGCAGGVARCGDALSLVCSSSGSALPEVCDGEDNDCDGKVDALDVDLQPISCSNQNGVCAGALTMAARCVAGGWQECQDADYKAHAADYSAAGETRCDGRDEDCDGALDEDFALELPTGQTVTGINKNCGAGECTGGVTACLADHTGTWCDSSVASAPEVCDGVDNDCDGETDGDDPDMQLILCVRQRGVCAGAMRPARLCAAGQWQLCDDAVFLSHDARYDGTTELRCDGIDNDCDGSSDEDFGLVGRDGVSIVGAGKACGTGACGGGVTACNTGHTGIECPGEARASAEVCNGQDDDCDALTDAADQVGGPLVLAACENREGVCDGATHAAAQCQGGQWGACEDAQYAAHDAGYSPGLEAICDGRDDDCDGGVDEDWTFTGLDGGQVDGAGQGCGAGVCAGGMTVCNPGGDGLVCDREALASTETCDGLDDDCDGRADAADASLERVPCDIQLGVCEGSLRPASACVDGQWTSCGPDVYGSYDANYQGGSERTCDAIDNDCDGRTDDDFVFQQKDGQEVTGGVGAACGVGLCAGGTLMCNPSGNGVACAAELRATSETCNLVDDDCDGFTDAADATLTSVPCERQAGVCAGTSKPSELCVAGAWLLCQAEVYRQHAITYEDGVEVSCDAIDNDCDGASDEDFALSLLDGRQVTGVAAACGVGACAGGQTRCNVAGAGIECSSEAGADEELCNDVDDDCDGLTDADDTSLVRTACSNQAGVCEDALALPGRCVAGLWQACGASDYAAHSPKYDGAAELHCDGLDNDCDTHADEDFVYVDPAGTTLRVGQQCGLGACLGGAVKCSGTGAATCTTASLARAEACEGSDEDCDGVVDDGCDDDGDDYCDKTMAVRELPPPAVCPNGGGDCNDQRGDVHPNAAEVCDGVDQDCDVTVDESWVDCHRGSCATSTGGFYATTPPDGCSAGHCAPVAPVSCGQYACVGGGSEGDVCAAQCGIDVECAGPAHCDQTDGKCKPDQVDGTACFEDSDCVNNHCQNGFCCASGDCCGAAGNCPAAYASAPACTEPATCTGTRKDKTCTASICGTTNAIADDRGCGSATLAVDCAAGYPDAFCSGSSDQSTPQCPTSCVSDSECVAGYHCDGTCVPDVLDGGGCDETSDCKSAHCMNHFCCASGDCCNVASSCPASYRQAPSCDDSTSCDGHRVDATCQASICGSTGALDDDRGCGAAVEANTCGLFTSRFCTGTDPQSTPQCPGSCATDGECDAIAHCDATCIQDVVDGGVCDEASDCASGYCANGHCCSGGACCAVATDCPASFTTPPACDTAATCQGTKDVATCVASVCGTALDVADDSACTTSVVSQTCGPFPSVLCPGGPNQDAPPCATACDNDTQCDANAYCRNGVCVPDETNGGGCNRDGACASAHCQNNFCCASGDCCAGANDCSSLVYAEPATCGITASCQGTRKDPVCASNMCGTSSPIDDDRGCAGVEANQCGPYPSVFCTNTVSQDAPQCAGMCSGDGDCDPGAFCSSGQCVPDQSAGQGCGATNECASGLTCVDGVCCTTACGGACRRCDVSGNGTCTVSGAGTDPDDECDGFSCTGYHFGFVGDACYYKADVSDAEAACGAGGACATRDQACSAQSQVGPTSPTVCDATCQDPVAGTCTGTVPGSCTNLNLGLITCGDGICTRSVARCVAGHENVCEPGPPSNEVCNTVDDDCDTATDANDPVDLVTYDLKQCSLQGGVCAGAKKPATLCVGGTWGDCGVVEYTAHDSHYQAGTELACDGFDNDCGGGTDEDFSMVTLDGQLKTGINASCGVGRCAGGHTECAGDGASIRCSSASSAITEVCNGADDDCDGSLDTADPSMLRDACLLTQGVCSGAMKPNALCQGMGGWGACTTATYSAWSALYQAGVETRCDAADNDCDGSTDEDFSYTPVGGGAAVSGINQPCGKGACAGGVTTCNPAGTGLVCSTAGNTSAEICDGIDNDCDGLVDGADGDMIIPDCENTNGVCAGAKKPLTRCGGGSGWAVCVDADYGLASQPTGIYFTAGAEQKCDGRDNDCNGAVDEDFSFVQKNGLTVSPPGPTQACGVGVCAGGVTRCKTDQSGLECPTEANASIETCDGVDNDCDGPIDAADGFVDAQIPLCTLQAGVCNGAKNEANDCVGGVWQACNQQDYLRKSSLYQEGVETLCDGADNDCGNGVDEDFSYTGLNNATYTTVSASCGVGNCVGGSIQCNAAHTGIYCTREVAPFPQPEACDTVDNNCNGVNNGSEITVLPACGNQVGECAGSTQQQTSDCVNNAWAACTAADYSLTTGKVYQSSETLCDNRDNDCDGVTETNETSSLAKPDCEKQLGVCAGAKKPSSLCVGGTFGLCTATQYTANDSSYSTTDIPDTSFADVNCDGIDGTESNALFVSSSGSGSACSKSVPCTFTTALATSTTKQHIYMRAGTYAGTFDVTKVFQIYGGYDALWARAARSDNPVNINGGLFGGYWITLRADAPTGGSASNPLTIADVNLIGANAGGSSVSSYVIWARSTWLAVLRCDVRGANGSAGVGGTGGTAASQTAPTTAAGGQIAEESAQACGLARRSGGAGRLNNCASSYYSQGGTGGQSGQKDQACTSCVGVQSCFCPNLNPFGGSDYDHCGATSGLVGVAGFSNGAASDGGGSSGSSPCNSAGTGGSGGAVDGTAGAAASTSFGSIASDHFSPASGGNGGLGWVGGGGGGGGGSGGCDDGDDSTGAGGGGGGAGGCAATVSGKGGTGGGASIGIWAISTPLVVQASSFTRGTGGAGGGGGSGANGQPGGQGGPGGAGVGSGSGGTGGAGGRGGHSAGGGGGAGGVSYGIFWSGGGINSDASSSNTFNPGGSGGTGGAAGGGSKGGTAGPTGDARSICNRGSTSCQ